MIFFPQKNRTHEIKTYGVGLVLGLLALITLPLIVQSNDYILQVFTHALLLGNLALAWNILGVSGSISLGHAAFFGAGAYCSALLSLEYGLSSWLTIPLGGLLATGLGLIMALICLRLRGAYFALATLASKGDNRQLGWTDPWISRPGRCARSTLFEPWDMVRGFQFQYYGILLFCVCLFPCVTESGEVFVYLQSRSGISGHP